jgi:hypothetical protein
VLIPQPETHITVPLMEASLVSGCEPAPRCAICDDLIGVYEPALVIEDGLVRRTSLAREPLLRAGRKMIIHGSCAGGLPSA